MRSGSESEKVTPSSPLSKAQYDQNNKQIDDIRRVRAILLSLLIIKLAFSIFYLLIEIVNLIQYTRLPKDLRDSSSSNALLLSAFLATIILIFLLLFICTVVQQERVGILIFAWLSIIDLLFVIVLLVLGIIDLIGEFSTTPVAGINIIAAVVLIILIVLALVLTIFVIQLSFKFVKLIKILQDYQRL